MKGIGNSIIRGMKTLAIVIIRLIWLILTALLAIVIYVGELLKWLFLGLVTPGPNNKHVPKCVVNIDEYGENIAISMFIKVD